MYGDYDIQYLFPTPAKTTASTWVVVIHSKKKGCKQKAK